MFGLGEVFGRLPSPLIAHHSPRQFLDPNQLELTTETIGSGRAAYIVAGRLGARPVAVKSAKGGYSLQTEMDAMLQIPEHKHVLECARPPSLHGKG